MTDVAGAGAIDVERLTRLDGATLRALVEHGRAALGESALDEWLLPVVAAHGWLFVARLDGGIVGAAEVIRSRASEELYLEGLYVRPRFQGRGYGGSLLRTAMAELGVEGFARISATLDPTNAAAAALYRSCGFRECGRLPDHYGAGRDRILLSARLDGEE